MVSEDNPERDPTQKRQEYAQARIAEYWLVNPVTETIVVYRLKGTRYQKAGRWGRGEKAASTSMPDLSVRVDDVLDAE